MKTSLVVFLALAVPLVLCYDEKYDKIDVDKILGDEDLFTAYVKCMLEKGPCEIEYSEDFRKLLPEVIATNCAKCSDFQKDNVKKTVKALNEKKPADFAEFRKKYDPAGKYEKDFMAFVFGQ